MKEALGTILVILVLFAFIDWKTSHAAELTPLQARNILYVAYGQYHGPRELLENPPTIHLASQDVLREKFHCKEQCPPIEGLFAEDSGEIYLFEELDFSTIYATTVLMHEYIHYFQAKTKGRVMDLQLTGNDLCLEIVVREHEAYRIQWEVLLKAGEYLKAQSVRVTAGSVHCS